LDATILKLSEQLKKERAGMDVKSQKHSLLLAQAEHITSRIVQIEGTKSEVQGDLRQTSAQVEKSREKMQRCRNEREANAAQREVEELHRLTRERESEIQKLQGFIELAKADLEAVTSEKDAAAAEIDGSEGETVKKVQLLQAEHDTAVLKREEVILGLGGPLRRRYDSILSRRGTAIARARAGRCISCHIELPPMLFQNIMRLEEVITCPSCLRILYWEPESAESGSDEASPDNNELDA
jgi:hypothetical protein